MINTQRQQILDQWHKQPAAGDDDIREIVQYAYYGHAGLVDVFSWYLIKIFSLGKYQPGVDISMAKQWEKLLSIVIVVSVIATGLITSSTLGINGRASALFPLAATGGALLFLAIISYRSQNRRARTNKEACRNCGYQLDPSFSVGHVEINEAKLAIGPQRCSECGQDWPLIIPH